MSRLRESYGGFVTAMRTLSILPMYGPEAKNMPSSLPWFPVAGLILGSLAYVPAYLTTLAFGRTWPSASAFVAVAAGVYLTRGFHLDGLSDWADGFGSIGDREKTLAIMKDSRVGVFGVLAVAIVLLGKWVAITRLFRYGAGVWLIPAYIISRSMIPDLAVRLPYARLGGGTAASVVTDSRPVHRIAALSISVLLTASLFGLPGLAALIIGLAATAWFGHGCRRRLGGVTGDLLGACCELIETLILLIYAGLADKPGILLGWHLFSR